MALEPEQFNIMCQKIDFIKKGEHDVETQGDIGGNYFRGRSSRGCINIDHISEDRQGE